MASALISLDDAYGTSKQPETTTAPAKPGLISLEDAYAKPPAAQEQSARKPADDIGPLVIPDDDQRKRLDSLADQVVKAGDLDRGYWSDSASTMVSPEHRTYFLKSVYERAQKSPINKDRGFLSRAGRGIARGAVGIKENIDDLLHEAIGEEKRSSDQIKFGELIRDVREQADPLTPEGMPFYKKWPIKAAEMAMPQAVNMAVAPGRAAATAFWTTQIFPGELQQMRDAGMDDKFAYPAAALSAVAQAAVETLNLSPLLPKQGIKPVVMYTVGKAAKDYGKELSEEGIQAAISETFQALGAAVDEQAPGKGAGEAFKNVANQMIEAAGPLAVMMAPGAAVTRYRTRNAPTESELKQQASPQAQPEEIPVEVDPSIGPFADVAGKPIGEVPQEPTGPRPEPTAESLVNDLIKAQEAQQGTQEPTPEPVEQSTPIVQTRWPKEVILQAEGAKGWAEIHPEAAETIRGKIAAGQPITRADVPDVDPADPLSAEDRMTLGRLLSVGSGKQPETVTPEPVTPSEEQPKPLPAPVESNPPEVPTPEPTTSVEPATTEVVQPTPEPVVEPEPVAKKPVIEETPAMKQWREQKKAAGGAVVLFRMGDFYETFNEDAEIVSQATGATLTRRGDVRLAGVPYYRLDKTIQDLVKAGHKVAVSEQVDGSRETRVVDQQPVPEPQPTPKKKPVKKTAVAETVGDDIVAVERRPEGAYEYRTAPYTLQNGKRGFRLEMRRSGSMEWDTAGAGHHASRLAAIKSISRVSGLGELDVRNEDLRQHLAEKQSEEAAKQAEKEKAIEDDRIERERETEFHTRMTEESKLNKWDRGEYDIFIPNGANKTVKGYKWNNWGLSKRDKKSTMWVLTHLPTGLEAGAGNSLDDAKAVAHALNKLGNWDFTNSKKIPLDQMGKASMLSKAWRRRGAPDYDKVPELAPSGYQPKQKPEPPPKKRPTRRPRGDTAAFMADPEAEEAEVAEAKAPNSGFATDFDHRETTTPPRPQSDPAQPSEPQDERKVQGIPMPELVKLAKWIQGHPPLVRRLGKALGMFKGTKDGMDIFVDPRVATDPNVMAQVLAHEMGHLIDFLPHRTLRRGNILGRIASLKDYMKNFLAGYPGGPGPLTDAERARLKKEAERLAKSTAEEEVDEVIRQETPITPQDVLNIWNSVEGDISPELLDYIKKLNSADKKSIVKEALKGIVSERLKRFARVAEVKTGQKIKRKVPIDAKTVHNKYRELIEEELKKRQIIEHEAIREELANLSHWWTPYNRQANSGQGAMYRRYRESSTELYAQALSVLLVAPKSLQQRAPQFWKAFWAYADRKRDVLKSYLDIQDMLFGLPERLQEIRRGDVREGFARGEEAVRARIAEAEARKRSILTDFGMGLFDQAMPILADAKSKPGSAQAESAMYALNELSHRDSPIKRWLDQVQDSVVDPIVALGMNLDHLGQYLAFRRMATERAEIANPYGHTVETSEQALADLRRELGDENWKALEKAVHAYDDLIFKVVEDAVAAGVYNRQTFETTLRPNKGQYATFAVVDHLDKEMPAEIRHQVGTFDEIGNPFSFTSAKMVALQRAIELNRAKVEVRNFYNKDFPGSLERKRVQPGQQPGRARPGNDHLLIMENGRAVFYETDAYIPAVFRHPDVKGLTRVAKLIGSTQYKVFHPLYVTLSPGWQIFNLPRDFKRTYKNLAAGRPAGESNLVAAIRDLGRLGKEYAKAFGPAWRRASGQFDPLIATMEENRSLDTALASYDWNDDSNVYERLLTRYGVMQDPAKREEANALRRGISSIFRFIERVGVTTETVSKAAAWTVMDHNGIDVRRRAHIVRNYIGTPNYHLKGTSTDTTNSLLMYSNVILQGWRADARVALDPKTAGGYWLRSLLVDFMPKAAMIGAAAGLFGASVAAWMAMIPDYDKSKYIIIPLGTTTDAKTGETKARYIRLPHDDVNRLICALMWEMSKGTDASASRMAAELYGEIPNASPGITMAFNWAQFLRGENPRDWFRDRDILSRDAFAVGGWHATADMLRWTANQFGVVSTLAHWAIGEPGQLSRESTAERIVGSIPGLDRIMKTSDRGMYEDAWNQVDMDDAEGARMRLSLDDVTRSLVKERYRLNRLGPERLSENDARRRALINGWYRSYLELTQAIKDGEAAKNTDFAGRVRTELKTRSERLQSFMHDNPDQAADAADRMRAIDAIEDLAASRPLKAADVSEWESKRAAARKQLDRMGLDQGRIRSMWAQRNQESLKTSSGRRAADDRLMEAIRK